MSAEPSPKVTQRWSLPVRAGSSFPELSALGESDVPVAPRACGGGRQEWAEEGTVHGILHKLVGGGRGPFLSEPRCHVCMSAL